ncbi:hypothetical protein CDAR_437531 [Caerostris darwini]|uniref:Uncharacterized protein n=1 Tax=Caerostris darwini TaxID=1538125 RepID=A0AAV4NT00_9ARAC|nr:hypothetical protein CDAR_437531 [Caerostris darwini]
MKILANCGQTQKSTLLNGKRHFMHEYNSSFSLSNLTRNRKRWQQHTQTSWLFQLGNRPITVRLIKRYSHLENTRPDRDGQTPAPPPSLLLFPSPSVCLTSKVELCGRDLNAKRSCQ